MTLAMVLGAECSRYPGWVFVSAAQQTQLHVYWLAPWGCWWVVWVLPPPGWNEGPEPSILLWALGLHPCLSELHAQKGQLRNGPSKWKVVVKWGVSFCAQKGRTVQEVFAAVKDTGCLWWSISFILIILPGPGTNDRPQKLCGSGNSDHFLSSCSQDTWVYWCPGQKETENQICIRVECNLTHWLWLANGSIWVLSLGKAKL